MCTDIIKFLLTVACLYSHFVSIQLVSLHTLLNLSLIFIHIGWLLCQRLHAAVLGVSLLGPMARSVQLCSIYLLFLFICYMKTVGYIVYFMLLAIGLNKIFLICAYIPALTFIVQPPVLIRHFFLYQFCV